MHPALPSLGQKHSSLLQCYGLTVVVLISSLSCAHLQICVCVLCKLCTGHDEQLTVQLHVCGVSQCVCGGGCWGVFVCARGLMQVAFHHNKMAPPYSTNLPNMALPVIQEKMAAIAEAGQRQ